MTSARRVSTTRPASGGLGLLAGGVLLHRERLLAPDRPTWQKPVSSGTPLLPRPRPEPRTGASTWSPISTRSTSSTPSPSQGAEPVLHVVAHLVVAAVRARRDSPREVALEVGIHAREHPIDVTPVQRVDDRTHQLDTGLHERGMTTDPPEETCSRLSTDVGGAASAETAEAGTIDMNLEVVTLPVSDVDRAKGFYESLGWRFDIDLVVSDDIRTVQFTPPHSACSIQFGKGGTTAQPGSAQAMILVVDDIDAARDDLVDRGVDVSEVLEARPPGFEVPGGRTSRARRSATPTKRLGAPGDHHPAPRPGRGRTDMDVAETAELLHETAEHHDGFEKAAPPHDWWDWYAAYFDARQSGARPTRRMPPRTATWRR